MAQTDENNDSIPPALIEGRDYYIEDGRWVFTEAYHRRRGYCCKSGCRHCPYGFRAVQDKIIEGKDGPS